MRYTTSNPCSVIPNHLDEHQREKVVVIQRMACIVIEFNCLVPIIEKDKKIDHYTSLCLDLVHCGSLWRIVAYCGVFCLAVAHCA